MSAFETLTEFVLGGKSSHYRIKKVYVLDLFDFLPAYMKYLNEVLKLEDIDSVDELHSEARLTFKLSGNMAFVGSRSRSIEPEELEEHADELYLYTGFFMDSGNRETANNLYFGVLEHKLVKVLDIKPNPEEVLKEYFVRDLPLI